MLMGSAGAQRDLLDSIIQDRPAFVVRIMLEQESHTSSSLVPATISVRYQLDLRSLRDDPHHSDGGPVWDKFLDAIFPAHEKSEKITEIPRVNHLNTFEVSRESVSKGIPPLLICSGILSAICGSSTLTGIP